MYRWRQPSFHLFTFSLFHLFTLSPLKGVSHLFTFSLFHLFTFKRPFTFSPLNSAFYLFLINKIQVSSKKILTICRYITKHLLTLHHQKLVPRTTKSATTRKRLLGERNKTQVCLYLITPLGTPLLSKKKRTYYTKTFKQNIIMAYVIGNDCIACGTCLPECPVEAISEGDIYKIDADACTECGTCASVCPSEAISLP